MAIKGGLGDPGHGTALALDGRSGHTKLHVTAAQNFTHTHNRSTSQTGKVRLRTTSMSTSWLQLYYSFGKYDHCGDLGKVYRGFSLDYFFFFFVFFFFLRPLPWHMEAP